MKIKVKKAQWIDNFVGVTQVEVPNVVDKLVSELREVSDEEFKDIVKLAKLFRRADNRLDCVLERYDYDYA